MVPSRSRVIFRGGGLVLTLLLAACGGDEEGHGPVAEATYVDPASCARCHAAETAAWAGSHHELAMQEATPATVLGDFDDAVFEIGGMRSRFYRRDGKFLVETDDETGTLREYQVLYTFGIDPLQQYLVPTKRGRLQTLPLCWDVNEKRWFHVYGEPLRHDDPLHWTGPFQNWNYMCAECHSTNLERGYDVATDTYRTTWSEINVGCQACHGPGSRHVAWAEEAERQGRKTADPGDPMGLVVRLEDEDPSVQVETCARCHSRRNIVSGRFGHGEPLLDHYDPELLVAPLYHPDGQILDEVYVYGSFLQAKKRQRGVRCSDCHDPHTTRLKHEGNTLCAECHQLDPPLRFPTLRRKLYDTKDHHHHEAGTPGAACVDCHMPATTYMQVDPRRDHGFRVPRPDLTESLSVPEPCTGCHREKDAAWATATIRAWYPENRQGSPHFASVFVQARAGDAGATPGLVRLARDVELPAIVRATALRELARFDAPEALDAFERALGDEDAMVRAAALDGVERLLPKTGSEDVLRRRLTLLAPRLDDPIRLVRSEAARALAAVPPSFLSPTQRQAFGRALEDYLDRQRAVADRPDGHLNLAVLYEDQGRPRDAEAEYLAALGLDDHFHAARFNLAVLYNRQGRNDEAEAMLRGVIARMPGHGEAHYSLGLLLAEKERFGDAADALSRAAGLLPGRPRVHYNRALVLQRLGNLPEAEVALRQARRLAPDDPGILQALALLYVERGRWEKAREVARDLRARHPDSVEVERLLRYVEERSR